MSQLLDLQKCPEELASDSCMPATEMLEMHLHFNQLLRNVDTVVPRSASNVTVSTRFVNAFKLAFLPTAFVLLNHLFLNVLYSFLNIQMCGFHICGFKQSLIENMQKKIMSIPNMH